MAQRLRIVTALAACLLLPFSLRACETCGCSAAGGNAGLLPGWGGHYLSLSYRLDRFDNGLQSLELDAPQVQSYDRLGALSLTGAWQPAPRWHLLGGVPLRLQKRVQGTETLPRTGMGDSWVLARYALWHPALRRPSGEAEPIPSTAPMDPVLGTKLRLLSVGLGLEAPTGAFRPEDDNWGLPVNNQLGSGSWDVLAELLLRLPLTGNHGLQVDLRGRYNGWNQADYRFGSQASAAVTWRWAWRAEGPWYGGIAAGAAGDFLGLDANGDYYRTDTGGKALLAVGGAQIGRGAWSLGVQYRQPIAQSYAGGSIRMQQSIDAGLTWVFSGRPQPSKLPS